MKGYKVNSCNTVLYGPVKISNMIVDFTASVLITRYEFYKVVVKGIPLYAQPIRQEIPYNERNDLRHNVPNWLGHISTQCKHHVIGLLSIQSMAVLCRSSYMCQFNMLVNGPVYFVGFPLAYLVMYYYFDFQRCTFPEFATLLFY